MLVDVCVVCRLLTEIKITDLDTAKQAIAKLHEMGAKTVVLSSTDLGTGDVLVTLGSQGIHIYCQLYVLPEFLFYFTGLPTHYVL
jgi:pyridoxal/pyridoxine/pyridoxamine kinase